MSLLFSAYNNKSSYKVRHFAIVFFSHTNNMFNTFQLYTLRGLSVSVLIAGCLFLAINRYAETWPSISNFR